MGYQLVLKLSEVVDFERFLWIVFILIIFWILKSVYVSKNTLPSEMVTVMFGDGGRVELFVIHL